METVAGRGIVMVANSGLEDRCQSGGGCLEKCLQHKKVT